MKEIMMSCTVNYASVLYATGQKIISDDIVEKLNRLVKASPKGIIDTKNNEYFIFE